ncbi:MAG: 3-deoxy-7-phosphoheptulonate synthase [Candidatus Krumholzibacteria bacterium]|nr:3-deoxy-7-phosphoheptulonate synthase [Candidatus Krumholzibacteria bacterium]MDH4337613.1 3-deoxy-7-phosphoheptulonate synthase [Candidatus Krumholzibacteria bacterium]MDH5270415.1 3-deoxy-7-phosphoheptulonate synthase [Candidatus Krumholzibacteria bacterium]MDH5628090.1 3-deoxy-7-phosphoheptulonate synthase [Candidatus Krumholzibacteria bacterium]
MIVVMKSDASMSDISSVIKTLESMGYRPHPTRGAERTIIGIANARDGADFSLLASAVGVEQVIPITKAYKMVSREFKPENTVVTVNGVSVGGKEFVVMAGPCAVEGREQVMSAARAVRASGASILRGGAFKPRTSPYSFQGLGEEGLQILLAAKRETGLPIVTEVITPDLVPLVSEYADILQIGARNMQNYALLEAVGKVRKPVLLKRGMMSTVEELLMAAEYVLSNGNQQVILCERGIRTFENATRNTLDISAVPVIKRNSHLPIIVDPSHAAGHTEFVAPLALAAVAAGADGIIVEVHPCPETAWCDGVQSLTPEMFEEMMKGVRAIAAVTGRPLHEPQ